MSKSEDKVLVIRKQDKTIHVVELVNKASILSRIALQPVGQKWTTEEMSRSEAAALPFIDENFVSPGEAVKKLDNIQSENNELKKANSALEKRLAQLEAMVKAGGPENSTQVSVVAPNADDSGQNINTITPPPPKVTADELIRKINAAETTGEVNDLLGTDNRATVKSAAVKRLAQLEAK